MKNSELIKGNPWKELSEKIEQNFFHLIENNSLGEDKNVIDNFNERQTAMFKLRTSMMPAHLQVIS